VVVSSTGSKQDKVWGLNASIFSAHSGLGQALSAMVVETPGQVKQRNGHNNLVKKRETLRTQ
jgi:hypothetical protein